MKIITLFTITLLCIIFITSAYQNNGNGNGNGNGNNNNNGNGNNNNNGNGNGNGNDNGNNYNNNNDKDKNKNNGNGNGGKNKYDMTTTDIFDDMSTTDIYDTDTTDIFDTDMTEMYNTYSTVWSKDSQDKDDCWRKRKRRKRQGNGKYNNDKNGKWGKKRGGKKWPCDDSSDDWLSSTYDPIASIYNTDDSSDDTTMVNNDGNYIDMGQAMEGDGKTGGYESNGNNIGSTIGIIGGIIGVIVLIICIIIIVFIYMKRNNKYDNVSVQEDGNGEHDAIEIGRALPTKSITGLNGENQMETHMIIEYECSDDENENEFINGRNDNYVR